MTTITYQGIEYPTKTFNGYIFASTKLWKVIINKLGILIGQEKCVEACDIESQVAFFFDDEEFESMTPEELYNDYDRHS